MTDDYVIIAGGGIGGFATALTLHQIGVSCVVLEQVSDLRPLGVGINMLPHAVRELTELGLQDELAAVGIKTRELVYANRHRQQILQKIGGCTLGTISRNSRLPGGAANDLAGGGTSPPRE